VISETVIDEEISPDGFLLDYAQIQALRNGSALLFGIRESA